MENFKKVIQENKKSFNENEKKKQEDKNTCKYWYNKTTIYLNTKAFNMLKNEGLDIKTKYFTKNDINHKTIKSILIACPDIFKHAAEKDIF